MAIAGSEDGRASPHEECGQPLEAEKGKKYCPVGPPEGIHLCQHLDFSPVRPTSGFSLTKLKDNCVLFQATTFVIICTAAIGNYTNRYYYFSEFKVRNVGSQVRRVNYLNGHILGNETVS